MDSVEGICLRYGAELGRFPWFRRRARVRVQAVRGQKESEGRETPDDQCYQRQHLQMREEMGKGGLPNVVSIMPQTANQTGLGCFPFDVVPFCATRTVAIHTVHMATAKSASTAILRMRSSVNLRIRGIAKIITASVSLVSAE